MGGSSGRGAKNREIVGSKGMKQPPHGGRAVLRKTSLIGGSHEKNKLQN